MGQTERIYFTDASVLEFSARVVDVRTTDYGEQVVLDKTAFYPTGGGQPYDTGSLNEARVVDVYEDDAGTIFHIVKEPGLLQVGESVTGRIDRERRLDHMQQHSGQHILSQAFVKACNAQTRSFHLGAQTSTIDIELYSPTDDHMRAAEEAANRVIFEDRLMRVHLVSEEEATRLPLRKELAVHGDIRVIEIEDFDWSPCGGTHAARSGQIGLIAIKSFERAKKMTRVEFVCGRRALEEYRRTNGIASQVAKLFSSERDAGPELAARALEENRALRKRLRELLELAMSAEAAGLLAETEATNNLKIFRRAYADRDVEEVRLLASKIVSLEPAVALLGTRDASSARLVFARSASLGHDMGKLMAEACKLLGGRGGGRPEMAQGGGPLIEKLEEALMNAATHAAQV
ncbi:MAG TPA: DHHA1 domain-containing protein [Blastocatellia bacterium]|nr:DHHA1 domain-containing protein [Blastocatellia bacterium]